MAWLNYKIILHSWSGLLSTKFSTQERYQHNRVCHVLDQGKLAMLGITMLPIIIIIVSCALHMIIRSGSMLVKGAKLDDRSSHSRPRVCILPSNPRLITNPHSHKPSNSSRKKHPIPSMAYDLLQHHIRTRTTDTMTHTMQSNFYLLARTAMMGFLDFEKQSWNFWRPIII